MLLTKDQAYLKSQFETLRWLTSAQCLRLLSRQNPKVTDCYVEKALGQMRHLGLIVRHGTNGPYSTADKRNTKPDIDLLSAVDIMLDVAGTAPIIALFVEEEPFKLSFLLEDDKGELKSFSIAAVRFGQEARFSFLFGSSKSFDKRTIFFVLESTTQIEKMNIAYPHFFALWDTGGVRYFKGKT